MTHTPIDVVGIGDGGIDSLSPAARAIVDSAEVLVGGKRHLAMLPSSNAERLQWPSPFDVLADAIRTRAAKRVCVLATGDPRCFGVGTTLAREFGASGVPVTPAPGAMSLACAALRWAHEDVEMVSVHGRPLQTLLAFAQPGVRLLVLAHDGGTAASVARILAENGFGASRVHVLEHLGGTHERQVSGLAGEWSQPRCADLCTLAIEIIADAGIVPRSRTPGLTDDAFEHDGQLTKQDVRAITLARLVPLPGQRLWDIGAGCGSIGIEWMRCHRHNTCNAVERNPARAQRIARNALALGTPGLAVHEADIIEAPESLKSLPVPDAVFIGGAVSNAALLDSCFNHLRSSGRLVANAVTAAGERALLDARERHGGELRRIALSTLEPLGEHDTFRPALPVTQWSLIK